MITTTITALLTGPGLAATLPALPSPRHAEVAIGELAVSPLLLLAALLGSAGVAAAYQLLRTLLRPPTTGPATMLGREAEVRSVTACRAQVVLDGVVWRARSPAALHTGQKVTVLKVDGLTLTVAPRDPSTPSRLDTSAA
jgi:membrane protein implicated in regulation of membrane protease activity